MNIVKKVDTIFPREEIPLLISPINLGQQKFIYCNYGELIDDTYKLINIKKKNRENQLPGAIDELITYDCSLWPTPEEVEKCKKRKRKREDNLYLDENSYLVVTFSFLFDLWNFSANADLPRVKEGPIGVIETKINWKEKKEILPAVFTSDDLKRAKKVSIEIEGRDLCNPVSYDVDLLIYGKGSQYFKGHIKYIVSTFQEKNTFGDEDLTNPTFYQNIYDDDDECKNPAQIYEEVTLQKYPKTEPTVYHINFIGTKFRD
jgi:hypothetical protein